ncbi:acyl-CoA dehydrogenase [Pseudonocardia spinosispora]|uniref:acyl-CoA dehydrogenase n=1 Tax=Pseudonocardia spinosispora TaxID=103441 RepID=UPI000409D9B3|nr:acyl-CoA dehydrogenase [Pseudonocardia spinosispora]
MTLAITDDHRELAQVARRFLTEQDARGAARSLLDAEKETLPGFWPALTTLGWLGLHLPERYGGEGYGLPELAVVLGEIGRAVAPGPFLPTVLAAAVLAEAGTPAQCETLLPDLARGARIGAVGLADADPDRGWLVLGGGLADLALVPEGDDLLVLDVGTVDVDPVAGMDPTRRVAYLRTSATRELERVVGGRRVALRLARTLFSAEAAGSAYACLDAAVAYVQQREQFGRTIGTFQAVKHHCANMAVDAELAVAAAWDAARAPGDGTPEEAELAAAVADVRAIAGAVRAAEMNIQLHGGIGYTWEHDAHLYLRRALAASALLDAAGEPGADLLRLASAGTRRRATLDLPEHAEQYREQARAVATRLRELSKTERRAELVSSGYLVPHWPPPWGRDADAVEQLVIEEEFAGIKTPSLGITGWVALTIAQHGTPEQAQRWIADALTGTTIWCQLFSEPGAGSDAAAISTRGVRDEGGWRVTGQKVWTSGAQFSKWGFATVRTDSSGSKHSGVTMMAIDLSARGVEVRPLRELTGATLFNEVFFDDVFVPDEDVVGTVGQGWAVARATLGNERVSIGGGASLIGLGATDLIDPVKQHPRRARYEPELAELLAEHQAKQLLGVRQAARAVSGAGPGPEGNLAKLLSAEHDQRVADLARRLAGTAAITGKAEQATWSYLISRCLTIAGGTSEIVRNQIAERILGLPRDPLQK